MQIVSLTAENIKKLKAVTIHPDGKTVIISGKNGQGKTSVLDSIWWALGGLAAVQGRPIREGEDKALIRMDLGEIVVTRTFKATEEGTFTSHLEVTSAEGAKFPSPQAMLDKLVGEMTFDPLAFARMDDKARFNMLRNFVQGFDFDAYDRAQAEDYAKRTAVNARAKGAAARASEIHVPSSAPDEPINIDSLVQELADVGKKAAEREAVVANRRHVLEDAQREVKARQEEHQGLLEHLDRTQAELKKLEALRADLQKKIQEARGTIAKADDALVIAQGGMENLPPVVDVDSIKRKVEDAKTLNASWELKNRKARAEEEAAEFKQAADILTQAMETRKEAKNAAIRESKMPLEGLTITEDNKVFLNGVPFGQGSDAEQLKASVAVGMALNPKVRVLRVRDGSLLDEDGMKGLAEMADLNDFQIWVERVDGSGKVGIVLENGEVKN